jgi:hypothetical protein
MMKKILVLSISALFTLTAHASSDSKTGVETDGGDNYATEHQELDNDLKNNLQMSETRSTDGRIELKDQKGDIYSYRPGVASATGGGCPAGQTVCYENAPEGNGVVVAKYSNGKTETFVGESHNDTQLTADAGALGLTLAGKVNGVATFRATAANGGTEYRVRYSPLLRVGAANVSPGIRVEQDGRIIERYADGLEQEILPIK